MHAGAVYQLKDLLLCAHFFWSGMSVLMPYSLVIIVVLFAPWSVSGWILLDTYAKAATEIPENYE